MCQKKPGNRCSSHAREALRVAEKELANLERKAHEKKVSFDVLDGPQCAERLLKAQINYDTTPEGMRKIEERLKKAEAEGKDTSVIQGYLDDRLALRNRRSEAYNILIKNDKEAKAIVESKKEKLFNRGRKQGKAAREKGERGEGKDNMLAHRIQFYKARNALHRAELEIEYIRKELIEKVDKGTITSRDYNRLKKATIKAGHLQNFAEGTYQETGIHDVIENDSLPKLREVIGRW